MKSTKLVALAGISLGTIGFGVTLLPSDALAYHKTNKWDVRGGLENGWVVIYSKELSHTEEAKLAIALASDATVSGGGATTAFFGDFARSSLQQIAQESRKKAPQLAEMLIRDLSVNKLLSAIRTSFNGKQVELSAAGTKVQVGRATYNRAECIKVHIPFVGKREKCTSTPNTYQPYIRFRT